MDCCGVPSMPWVDGRRKRQRSLIKSRDIIFPLVFRFLLGISYSHGGVAASCENMFSFAGGGLIRGCFYCGLELGKSLGVVLLAHTGIGNNRLKVEMEFLGDFFAGVADLLDGVEVLDFVHSPMSSSGVQTTGQVYPSALIAFSTIGRSWALFKWVQFQVKKKSIE